MKIISFKRRKINSNRRQQNIQMDIIKELKIVKENTQENINAKAIKNNPDSRYIGQDELLTIDLEIAYNVAKKEYNWQSKKEEDNWYKTRNSTEYKKIMEKNQLPISKRVIFYLDVIEERRKQEEEEDNKIWQWYEKNKN